MKSPVSPILRQRHAHEQGARSHWSGLGEAWTFLSYIMSGILVWGGIGYGLDRLFDTRPVLMVIGALMGNFVGIYAVYIRAFGSGPGAVRAPGGRP